MKIEDHDENMPSYYDVPTNFIGDFKTGDNIRYNCEVLCDLFRLSGNGKLSKPIIIQCVSIIEALFMDLVYRVNKFTKEGVTNISKGDIEAIRNKKVDKLNIVIDVFAKHGIIGGNTNISREQMHRFRRLRNCIHIGLQLPIPGIRDEDKIFDMALAEEAVELLEKTIQHLNDNFCRPSFTRGHSNTLVLPRR